MYIAYRTTSIMFSMNGVPPDKITSHPKELYSNHTIFSFLERAIKPCQTEGKCKNNNIMAIHVQITFFGDLVSGLLVVSVPHFAREDGIGMDRS